MTALHFQQSVNRFPAPAVEGDFASSNPYRSLIAGKGELKAGVGGVIIGRFAFARYDNGITTSAHPGVACRFGFAQRSQPAPITTWLDGASMVITQGLEVTLHDGGDFWARAGAGGASVDQKVWASYGDGSISTGASAPAGASFTGVIAASVLTASAVTGVITPGQRLSGAGVAAGSYIGPQLSGTPGGAGTYTSVGTPSAASVAMTTSGGVDTGFIVQSAGGPGELIKIARIPSNAA